jgi:hypothetical protein
MNLMSHIFYLDYTRALCLLRSCLINAIKRDLRVQQYNPYLLAFFERVIFSQSHNPLYCLLRKRGVHHNPPSFLQSSPLLFEG